jgi:hypothetical protein
MKNLINLIKRDLATLFFNPASRSVSGSCSARLSYFFCRAAISGLSYLFIDFEPCDAEKTSHRAYQKLYIADFFKLKKIQKKWYVQDQDQEDNCPSNNPCNSFIRSYKDFKNSGGP